MQTIDFVTSQELKKLIVNWKVDIHKEKIRSTKLDREKPFHLHIIYDDEKVDLKYQSFYRNLRTNNLAQDYDLAKGNSDNELVSCT